MPELPEVETVRAGLARAMTGRRLSHVTVRRPDLRFPFPRGFAKRLTGARVRAVRRRAKYLLADLDSDLVLIMHLGMSGRFTIFPPPVAKRPHAPGGGRHDHVVFDLENGARIVYTDPRRFGLMDLSAAGALERHKLFKNIGIEPLSAALNADFIAAALNGRRTPLKAALLDQKIIAGIGNIYACEILHRARLSPRRSSHTMRGQRAARLAAAVGPVLRAAIAAGGSTLRDYAQTDGSLGYFQHAFAVYDREGLPCPAPGCAGRISRIVQAGRSTYFCARCQR